MRFSECRLRPGCFVLAFFISWIACNSQTFNGNIIRIIDGDMFLFQTRDSTFTVHLYGIDAPEKGQAYGIQTIAYLEAYLGVYAEINIKKTLNMVGHYALLFVDGKNLNKFLVKNGFAWYDRIHFIDEELARSEIQAREKKLGLWQSPNPAPPWDFRNGKLAKPPATDGKTNVLICTGGKDNFYHKKYCRKLELCQTNIIVLLREQARDLKMKPCKYCF